MKAALQIVDDFVVKDPNTNEPLIRLLGFDVKPYEVPCSEYVEINGKRLKYSSCMDAAMIGIKEFVFPNMIGKSVAFI